MLTLKEKKSDNWQRDYLEKEKRKKEAEKWATLLVTLLLTNKKKKKKKMQLCYLGREKKEKNAT